MIDPEIQELTLEEVAALNEENGDEIAEAKAVGRAAAKQSKAGGENNGENSEPVKEIPSKEKESVSWNLTTHGTRKFLQNISICRQEKN